MATQAAAVKRMSKPEMMALSPTSRDKYVHDLIYQVIPTDRDWTIRDITRETTLSRNTVIKHLQQLVSEQRLVSTDENLGAFRIRKFRRAGEIMNKTEAKSAFAGRRNYIFFTIDSGDSSSAVVQQREKDELGIDQVKGAIAVDFDDLHSFIKEFASFVNKVARK
jgi:hypothetical protein